MIKAEDARKKIIKDISKSSYIKNINDTIRAAIAAHKFDCTIEIDEYDEGIEVSISDTAICAIKYLGSLGYNAYITTFNNKYAEIKISWGVN